MWLLNRGDHIGWFDCISGSYGTVVVKLKLWQQELIEIVCEYTEP
jgi:hypothetical protein